MPTSSHSFTPSPSLSLSAPAPLHRCGTLLPRSSQRPQDAERRTQNAGKQCACRVGSCPFAFRISRSLLAGSALHHHVQLPCFRKQSAGELGAVPANHFVIGLLGMLFASFDWSTNLLHRQRIPPRQASRMIAPRFPRLVSVSSFEQSLATRPALMLESDPRHMVSSFGLAATAKFEASSITRRPLRLGRLC